MCLRNKPISLTRGALWVRAWERCFCLHLFLPFAHSGGSIPETPSTSESLHCMSSRRFLIGKNCFAHPTHVGHRHRRDVQLQPMSVAQPEGTHFMRHFRFARFKKSVHLSPSHVQPLHLNVLCLFLSQERLRVLGAFLVAGWLCSSMLLESRFGQVRKKLRHARKNNFLKSPFSSRTRSSPPSISFRGLTSSRNCFAHGVA